MAVGAVDHAPWHGTAVTRLERAKGIEPSYAAWEAAVLPLNYARVLGRWIGPIGCHNTAWRTRIASWGGATVIVAYLPVADLGGQIDGAQ